jgi:hypothetical protein
MASGRRKDFSSPFDEMLEENRRQFEALYGGSRSGHGEGAAREPARPSPSPAPGLSAEPSHGARQAGLDASSSEAVRFLNDRYGEGWRYEITNRQRDGEEVVVLCKLVVEDQGITKSQFGRARIGDSGEAYAIKGSAAGIAFSTASDKPPPGARGDPVEDAFRRAEDAALARCAGLI